MTMDIHETVWSLGAEEGRRSTDGDVDGAWLKTVKKHGTRVFPSARSREDDPWFDEYFEAFRDGFDSSYR